MITNFLYAFDNHYNIQAFVSIYSLLQNVSEKIRIYIITDSSNKHLTIPEKILNHNNLDLIEIKQISLIEQLYNLDEAHVSQATFYRLYLTRVFPELKQNIIYLDADIICVNDPINLIRENFENIKNENYFIGFADELYKYEYSEPFERLEMSGIKYFNAGVMLMNASEWGYRNLTSKSLTLINKLKNKAKYWDQDVLNSLIDGEYLSISPELNYRTNEEISKKAVINEVFIHYSGKSKPWDIAGILEEFANEYHKIFEELFNTRYHLVCRNRRNSIKKLLRNLNNLYKSKDLKFFKYLFKSFYIILKK